MGTTRRRPRFKWVNKRGFTLEQFQQLLRDRAALDHSIEAERPGWTHGPCWMTPCIHPTNGYGTVSWHTLGSVHPQGEFCSHRASYRVFHLGGQPIPAGAYVTHTCDTKPCCNPDHLQLGSPQSNMDDMSARQRAGTGARNPKFQRLVADMLAHPEAPDETFMERHGCARKTCVSARRKIAGT